MIRGKYHGNTSYLLRNVDAGTQEFAGTGNCVNEGQTRRTGTSQMMTSRRSCTSQSHKQVVQTKSHKIWNVDAGTQEFAGTGNCVNEGQTRQTDESQMMTSRWGRTSESH